MVNGLVLELHVFLFSLVFVRVTFEMHFFPRPSAKIASEGRFWAREDGLKGRDCYNSVITNFRAIRKTAFQVKQKETPGSVKNCRAFLYSVDRSYSLMIRPKYSLVMNKTNPDCSEEFVMLS